MIVDVHSSKERGRKIYTWMVFSFFLLRTGSVCVWILGLEILGSMQEAICDEALLIIISFSSVGFSVQLSYGRIMFTCWRFEMDYSSFSKAMRLMTKMRLRFSSSWELWTSKGVYSCLHMVSTPNIHFYLEPSRKSKPHH